MRFSVLAQESGVVELYWRGRAILHRALELTIVQLEIISEILSFGIS